ncbi:hypothetical protein KP509_13G097700 [Ceratopteris richardii]|uniref:Uncharacterized protein n=1 Tax=Ceratopteris richardii TaxID=49495 RepID=A0A8T2TK54_CERRI|nr:hypothetical protein KP509_13G097700 [Ceratopteris richardii]
MVIRNARIAFIVNCFREREREVPFSTISALFALLRGFNNIEGKAAKLQHFQISRLHGENEAKTMFSLLRYIRCMRTLKRRLSVTFNRERQRFVRLQFTTPHGSTIVVNCLSSPYISFSAFVRAYVRRNEVTSKRLNVSLLKFFLRISIFVCSKGSSAKA